MQWDFWLLDPESLHQITILADASIAATMNLSEDA